MTSKTIQQRLESKIKFGPLFEGTPCWEYQGSLLKGYGHINVGGGKTAFTHRLTYMAKVGPIAKGLDVHHRCENRACCNPDHLEALTRAEHIAKDLRSLTIPAQSRAAGAVIAAKLLARTHCARGHEFTPENTYYPPGANKDGRIERNCRACMRTRKLRKKGKLC